jgi:hypothetical protein
MPALSTEETIDLAPRRGIMVVPMPHKRGKEGMGTKQRMDRPQDNNNISIRHSNSTMRQRDRPLEEQERARSPAVRGRCGDSC